LMTGNNSHLGALENHSVFHSPRGESWLQKHALR
jgi:hypothetical protein